MPSSSKSFPAWLPDGYSQIFRSYVFGPSGFWTMAPLRYAAKFDPFLSLDCDPTPSTLAQSKERKGSNFAIWQPWLQGGSREGQLNKLSRSQSAQRLNPGNSERTQRGKDMKSYLISQVLFDGQENIQASAKDAKPLLQVGSTGFSPEVEVFRMQLFWRRRCLNGYFPV